MKIAHLAYTHKDDDTRIFIKECRSLARMGHTVTYITSDKNSERKDIVKDSIHIKVIARKKGNKILCYSAYLKELKRLCLSLEADVYHLHEPGLIPVGNYLVRRGKHVIYDSHEDVPRQMLPFFQRLFGKKLGKLASVLLEKYEKMSVKRFAYVITATDHIKELFQPYTSNVKAIKNFPMLEDIIDTSGNYLERKEVICYAGGLSESRGITNLVKAIEHTQVELYLAGNIEKEYERNLSKLEAWSRVRLLGMLNREEINKLYSESRMGMVTLLYTPNHYDALPIKMFEYMAAGLPLISSDFPLWKKIIEEEQCGICINPDNVEEITRSIDKILKNKEAAMKMGQNGRRAIETKYNWGIEEKKLYSLYGEIKTGLE
jgi:glycosyltransferase involved in cell wall biosynthesis